jgi:predicted MPP superfamily phosphohydrolase
VRRLLRLAGWLALVGLGLAAGLLGYGLIAVTAQPVERQVEIVTPGLPAGSPPFRVALLSDIHFGNRAMQRPRLDAIVAAVNAAKPDLVVIAGDFVNGRDGRIETNPADLVAPLAGLRAPHGVIASLGNHDHWTDPARIRRALAQAGITVLANQAAQRGPLVVLGVDDGHTHHDDIAAALASAKGMAGLRVVVTHSPDLTPRLPATVGQVLAGHTHCGQVVLPLLGSLAPLVRRYVYNRHYTCGVIRDPGRTVVITGGLGSGSVPVRIGAAPDWWLVTFRAP